MAENCHYGKAPWKHGGWAHKFSTCHWVDVDNGDTRIYSPADESGYAFCDGTGGVDLISFSNGVQGDDYREVIMTYPVFKTDNF